MNTILSSDVMSLLLENFASGRFTGKKRRQYELSAKQLKTALSYFAEELKAKWKIIHCVFLMGPQCVQCACG